MREGAKDGEKEGERARFFSRARQSRSCCSSALRGTQPAAAVKPIYIERDRTWMDGEQRRRVFVIY